MLYNRRFASVCLAAVVVLSLIFGTARSVFGLSSDVVRAYSSESKTYGSVQTDINKLISGAAELLSIYTAVYGSDADTLGFASAISDLKNLADNPVDAKFSESVVNLRNYASAVYYKLEITKEIENTQEYNSSVAYYREIQSTLMRIENNKNYSNAVVKYNNAISSFPGNIVAGIFSMPKVLLISY